jgi:hypothetical protein
VCHARKDGVQTGEDNQRSKDGSQEANASGWRTLACSVCVVQMLPALAHFAFESSYPEMQEVVVREREEVGCSAL